MLTILLIGAAAVIAALIVVSVFVKKWWIRILLWALAVLACACGGLFWYFSDKAAKEARAEYEEKARIAMTHDLAFTNATLPKPEELAVYPNLTAVDLRGTNADADYYRRVKENVPENCIVLWSVSLTDGRFDSNATSLVLPNFNEKDAEMLRYFPDLKTVDASGSTDYDCLLAFPSDFPDIALTYTLPLKSGTLSLKDTELTLTDAGDLALLIRMLPAFSALEKIDLSGADASVEEILALQEAFPEGECVYSVPVGGMRCPCTEETLALSGAGQITAEELIRTIPLFQNLREVDLHGTALSPEDILLLKETFPDTAFSYAVTLFGKEYESDADTIDLKNSDVKTEDLVRLLRPFAELKTVYLPERAADDPAVSALEAACPGVLFVHNVKVFGRVVSNDIEELDISKTKVGTSRAVEDQIALLPRLRKIIMNGCGLGNEEMGALQAAHPEVKFVWTVRIGPHNVRTDAIGFSTKNPSKYTNPKATDAYNQLVVTRKRLKEGDLENIKYCTDLVALDVGHNYLTNKDLEVLQYLPHLQILILADNKITDISAVACLKELRYIELFMNRIADMSPLVGLPDLIDINICNTHLESIEPLKQFTQAERLWFAMNGLTSEQNREVVEALPNCLCNYTTRDETQEGWREHERYFWMRSFFK